MVNGENDKRYSICVIGAGHVGLVSAACFAELGNKVICVDNDKNKIAALKKLIMPYYEPGLETLVKKNFKQGNLTFSFSVSDSVKKSQVIFIAVGTPPLVDGSADLSAIENVTRVIADNLNSYKLIVEKSTVPVQTGNKIKETILRYGKNSCSFDVASNPEFSREGKAIEDFLCPDRIVIGVESEKARTMLEQIYVSIKAPIIVTDINTAELIKHACNSFLAMKIFFINAVSSVRSDLAGADINKIAEAMGMDKRIGKEFLQAGLGYGGFCFPKDVEAFIDISNKLGYNFNLMQAVKDINDQQWSFFFDKVKERLWILKDKKIAVLGLSFKPDTDDVRFAPSINIITAFLNEGAQVVGYDPQAVKEAKKILSSVANIENLQFADDVYRAVKDCDCIFLVTEWEEFKTIDFKKVKKLMRYPFIADGRNLFDHNKLLKMGFEYIGIGRNLTER